MKKYRFILILGLIFLSSSVSFNYSYSDSGSVTYEIVDTAQSIDCDDNSIIYPDVGEVYFGQDANYLGNTPNYRDNGDGTITDHNTNLMWQQDPDDKKTFENAISDVSTFNLAGYTDWRLPTIKELYSLILFSGTDISGVSSISDESSFIDTDYFTFEYGDESAGERLIDSQYWSSTEYVSNTMDGDETVFGVNFADGRIKGYPKVKPDLTENTAFVLYTRGNTQYGLNNFTDNGDGTISDSATSLMWTKLDSGRGMNWEDSLSWVQEKNAENFLGYSDWRLTNAKELQSIVDYSRSPATNGTPAIDPIFNTTEITAENGTTDYPYFWTSTTHISSMGEEYGWAVYIAFGTGFGYMEGNLMDVHGAGCQRSDPKSGSASAYPEGHGPQGDVVRVLNFVRLVRGGVAEIVLTESPTNVGKIVVGILIFGVIAIVSIIHLRKRKLKKASDQ